MGRHLLKGDPPVELHLRRSPRARRISLRVSQLDGKVTLTLPAGLPEREALDFAESRAEWIRRHTLAVPDTVPVLLGSRIPVEGVLRRIVPGDGRAPRLTDDALGVPGRPEGVPGRVAGFLKTLARDRLVAASDRYATALGRDFQRLSLRDTRSRWGSCSSAGTLMYSWRLILAPPEVLNYVAAHEVAHLAEMNHSPAFWARVEAIHGPFQAPRRWLREHGPGLHRYRFDA